MYLSLKDGSRGVSDECRLAKNESKWIPLSIPAADSSVWTYKKHSFSSSSGLNGVVEVLPGTRAGPTADSSHDRVRAMDPIGGDLPIKLHLIGSTPVKTIWKVAC